MICHCNTNYQHSVSVPYYCSSVSKSEKQIEEIIIVLKKKSNRATEQSDIIQFCIVKWPTWLGPGHERPHFIMFPLELPFVSSTQFNNFSTKINEMGIVLAAVSFFSCQAFGTKTLMINNSCFVFDPHHYRNGFHQPHPPLILK